MIKQSKYTQREWDRVVGYGKVPEEYSHVPIDSTDGQDSKRSNQTREEVEENDDGCESR